LRHVSAMSWSWHIKRFESNLMIANVLFTL
jgi:hypothetical protein